MSNDKKVRILIADDEGNILEAVKMVLEDRYDITTSMRGDEALRLYKEGDFDLVISDVRMPGLDGIDLFREVRKRNPHQRFIFISVSSVFYDDADAHSILFDQSSGFLGKPYRIAELMALIEKVLATPGPHRSS